MKKGYMVIIRLNNQGLIRPLFGFAMCAAQCRESVISSHERTEDGFLLLGIRCHFVTLLTAGRHGDIFSQAERLLYGVQEVHCSAFGLCLPGVDVSLMGNRRPPPRERRGLVEKLWLSGALDVHANVTLM